MRRLDPRSRSLASLALLAALLGTAAPLAHAHLAAASWVTSGLCGEHDRAPTAEDVEPCSLCLAGAQPRALTPQAALRKAPAPRLTLAARAPVRTRADLASAPAHPRAPPRI